MYTFSKPKSSIKRFTNRSLCNRDQTIIAVSLRPLIRSLLTYFKPGDKLKTSLNEFRGIPSALEEIRVKDDLLGPFFLFLDRRINQPISQQSIRTRGVFRSSIVRTSIDYNSFATVCSRGFIPTVCALRQRYWLSTSYMG